MPPLDSKYIPVILACSLVALGLFLITTKSFLQLYIFSPPNPEIIESPVNTDTKENAIDATTTVPAQGVIKSVLIDDVPFTAQAPFAEWKDPRQQDGCEEAAALMAVYWATGRTIEKKEDAKKEILAISLYQEKNFGEYHDTSAQDTIERIIKGHFAYDNVWIDENITIDSIIKALMENKIVVVPANGQSLNNPHFTQPGPERHNLVIIGYDLKTKEFITNDPGIRQGKGYRYRQQVLFDAIRDYPTGYHVPITEVKKTGIIVSK